VLGIVWVFGLGAILAVIFGFVARKQIRESKGRQSGSGMATAGIVLGFVGIAGLIGWVVLLVAIAHNVNDCSNNPNACDSGSSVDSYITGTVSGAGAAHGGSPGAAGTSANSGPNGSTPNNPNTPNAAGAAVVTGPAFAFFSAGS
jgi:hypothetical protein